MTTESIREISCKSVVQMDVGIHLSASPTA